MLFLEKPFTYVQLNKFIMFSKLKKHIVFKIVPKKKVVDYPENIKKIKVKLEIDNEKYRYEIN